MLRKGYAVPCRYQILGRLGGQAKINGKLVNGCHFLAVLPFLQMGWQGGDDPGQIPLAMNHHPRAGQYPGVDPTALGKVHIAIVTNACDYKANFVPVGLQHHMVTAAKGAADIVHGVHLHIAKGRQLGSQQVQHFLIRKGRAGNCRQFLQQRRCVCTQNAFTNLLNSRPRYSNVLNWSKAGQAGQRDTISPGCAALRAASTACAKSFTFIICS